MDASYAYYTNRYNVYRKAMTQYYDKEYKQWQLEKDKDDRVVSRDHLDRTASDASTHEKKIEISDAK